MIKQWATQVQQIVPTHMILITTPLTQRAFKLGTKISIQNFICSLNNENINSRRCNLEANFQNQPTSINQQKVMAAPIHMDDQALIWWQLHNLYFAATEKPSNQQFAAISKQRYQSISIIWAI